MVKTQVQTAQTNTKKQSQNQSQRPRPQRLSHSSTQRRPSPASRRLRQWRMVLRSLAGPQTASLLKSQVQSGECQSNSSQKARTVRQLRRRQPSPLQIALRRRVRVLQRRRRPRRRLRLWAGAGQHSASPSLCRRWLAQPQRLCVLTIWYGPSQTRLCVLLSVSMGLSRSSGCLVSR